MHEPNPIDIAAKASGEPEFREVGVGPWAQTHPDEPAPINDPRYDPELLAQGDRRNVLDRYRYWSVEAIKADLDAQGRHSFEVAIENWTHDFNIGSMVRTANAFTANCVHIVGPHKWNRKGALMTELYQRVENHPSIQALVDDWHTRIAAERADAQARVDYLESIIARASQENVTFADNTENSIQPEISDISDTSDISDITEISDSTPTSAPPNPTNPNTLTPENSVFTPADLARAQRELLYARRDLRTAQNARIIAMDIIDGAVPLETFRFPERCLLLFGAEGPGLSQKALDLADDVVYISQFGSVRSINAGAAAAVSMHAWITQHAAPVK